AASSASRKASTCARWSRSARRGSTPRCSSSRSWPRFSPSCCSPHRAPSRRTSRTCARGCRNSKQEVRSRKDLSERSFQFACDVYDFCEDLVRLRDLPCRVAYELVAIYVTSVRKLKEK